MEIDRLTRLSAEQKRKIAELECSMMSGKFDAELRPINDDVRTYIIFIFFL